MYFILKGALKFLGFLKRKLLKSFCLEKITNVACEIYFLSLNAIFSYFLH